MEVSTADLAEILGVSERRIQQLANTGVLTRAGHGNWPLPASVQAFIAHRLKSAKTATKAKSGSTDEKIKLVKLRREEMRLANDERLLIPLEEAIGVMSEVSGAVAFEMNTVAPAFTRDVAERDRLQKLIEDGLERVADRLGKSAAALRPGGGDDPPDEEDDA